MNILYSLNMSRLIISRYITPPLKTQNFFRTWPKTPHISSLRASCVEYFVISLGKGDRNLSKAHSITGYSIWGLWCQKQVSQAGISNCIPQHTVGCNYLSLSEIPASGAKVLISGSLPHCVYNFHSSQCLLWVPSLDNITSLYWQPNNITTGG